MASATAVYYLSQQVGMTFAVLQQLLRRRLNVGLGDIALSKKIEVCRRRGVVYYVVC